MSQPSKVSGTGEYYKGAAQETLGSIIGNTGMQAEGAKQKATGDAEIKAAKTQGYAEGTKDRLTGHVKETAGSVVGNEQMQAEGKGSKLSGEAQQKINQ
ncbi:hypothetical protein G9A89_018148 [Geosiphon pyriformis]|nr:hypothetical protein G9A89_018148 [Geosiphon pyriformis]